MKLKTHALPIAIITVMIFIGGIASYMVITHQDQPSVEQVNEAPVVREAPEKKYVSAGGENLTIKSLFNLEGQKLSSPLEISGIAPREWGKDDRFVIRILGSSDNLISEGYTILGVGGFENSSNSADELPFTATLFFEPQPSGTKGTVRIEKATPGLREDSIDSISIPVEF